MSEKHVPTGLRREVVARARGVCEYIKQEAVDPITGQLVALFHPRQQRWSEHFAWSADATLIIGLTPKGRATVEALRLNRIELVNLREVLYAAQEHPPTELGVKDLPLPVGGE